MLAPDPSQQLESDLRPRREAKSIQGQCIPLYTLSAGGVALSDLPAAMAKRLPRYPSVPIARLGRLAVDSRHRGNKLGAALLFDAVHRAANSEVMMFALVVEAKDDQAVAFYQHHGFISVGDPRQLMVPLGRFAG